MKKKGQEGIRAVFITVIVAGILALVSVLIFTKVNQSVETTFDRTSVFTIDNESATVTVNDYYGSIANPLECSISQIWNSTGFMLFNTSTYTLQGCSINLSCDAGDPTQCIAADDQSYDILVTYNYRNYSDAEAMTTYSSIGTTVLDSFELAVISLIVLAAVAILSVLFIFGGK